MTADDSRPNHRILVIDDMAELHTAFRRLLCGRAKAPDMAHLESSLFGSSDAVPARAVFEVDTASQGQEGLALVRKALEDGRPYAMAFVDMRMPPGWDGLRTIEEIWKEYPDLEIVICTAYSDYSDDDIVARLGASDQVLFLRKPFDAIEVRQLARALTEKWSLRQQARLQLAELERHGATRVRELSSANARLVEETEKLQAIDRRLRIASARDALGHDAVVRARDVNDALHGLIAALEAPPATLHPTELAALRDAMTGLNAATTSMMSLVPRLAKLEAESPAHALFDIDATIAEVVDMLKDSIATCATIELDLQPLPHLPLSLADLKLALVGIVDNAIQAVDRDKLSSGRNGHIRISTRRDSNDAVIAISDSGAPVSAAQASHLFDPWFVPGTGERPGFAFAWKLVVDELGGQLAIEPGSESGVTLLVRLPIADAVG